MALPQLVVVDDEPSLRAIYQAFLGSRCEVMAFGDGESFLEALPGLDPATFVLDWMLPDTDGIALCRRIRQERRFDNVPVAFLTAMRPSVENLRQVFDAGGQLFIEKGGSPTTIISQIFSQVDAYERWNRGARLDAAVLASLRHDLMGYLSGTITGVEVLALDPIMREKGRAEQVTNILESGVAIRELVDDMGVVLRAARGDADCAGPVVSFADIRAHVLQRLSVKEFKVEFAEPEADRFAPLLCGRILYYLALLLRYRYAVDNAVRMSVVCGPDGRPVCSVFVSVRGAEDLQEILLGPVNGLPSQAPEQALPVQFVNRALTALGARLSFTEGADGCELSFAVPPPAEESATDGAAAL